VVFLARQSYYSAAAASRLCSFASLGVVYMTNEEIQRTMEFIIKQQESFAESMEKADGRMNRLESAFVTIFNMVTETAKAQKELTEKVNALAEAQANTDERLNILITTVERYFNDKRNGESRG
jgi:hypothetical protein